MRLALMVLPLLAVAFTTADAAPKKKRRAAADTSQPVDRACTVKECFNERDVRDFEVIDQSTLIVYVGAQRCAFRIELRGTFCDMTFAPEIFFRSTNDFERSDDRDSFAGGPVGGRWDMRVCSNDVGIGVDGGVFTEDPQNLQSRDSLGNRRSSSGSRPLDRFGNPRSECQVSSVASVTDDALLQLYVDRGVVPPPPPMGSGEIEVGEQEDRAAPAPAEPADAAADAVKPNPN